MPTRPATPGCNPPTDGAHSGALEEMARRSWQPVPQIAKRADDTRGFNVPPRRWRVERPFAWLLRTRRLSRDYETLPDTAEAMITWSMTMVMTRRPGRARAGRPPTAP